MAKSPRFGVSCCGNNPISMNVGTLGHSKPNDTSADPFWKWEHAQDVHVYLNLCVYLCGSINTWHYMYIYSMHIMIIKFICNCRVLQTAHSTNQALTWHNIYLSNQQTLKSCQDAPILPTSLGVRSAKGHQTFDPMFFTTNNCPTSEH